MADVAKRRIVELESALSDSEERFLSLTEAAREGISVHDGNRILLANRRLAEMLGYSVSDLLGHDPLEFMAPDARDSIAARIAAGSEEPYQATARRRDGSVFPVEISARPAIYKGRHVRVVVIADLSEKRASDLRFQVLFENSRDAIAVADGETLTWVNAALARMMRADHPSKLIGRSIYDLAVPESRHVIETQRANRTVGHEEPAVYEFRALRLDGTVFEAEIRASTFDAGVGRQTIAFLRDITADRAAEEELRLSETRFRSLFDQSPMSTQIFDPQGFAVRANRAWSELFGIAPELIVGYNIFRDLQLAEGGLMPLIHRAFSGDAVFLPQVPYSMDHGRRKGETLWLEAIMYPLIDGNGRVRELVLLHQDVTAHKRAEQQLLIQAKELARSNADLQQFAYVASHDLQEPLRVMSTFASLLSRRYQGKLDPQADKYLEFMTTAAQRMSELVRDILTYSRATADHDAFTTVDLNVVVQTVLHSLEGTIESAGARIDVQPMPEVRGNRAQLTQLLLNLVSNAIKYRDPDRQPIVRIGAVAAENEWIVEVADNGIGISPEYHDRIFGMFKRLHSRAYAGTGIGLAIAKRIAEAHGGSISLTSAAGEGATFRVHLPAFPAA